MSEHLFASLITDAQLAAIRSVGHEVEQVAITADRHAEVRGRAGSGDPLVMSIVADYGVTLIATAEGTSREVIQSLLNDCSRARGGAEAGCSLRHRAGRYLAAG